MFAMINISMLHIGLKLVIYIDTKPFRYLVEE